ncbi:MAG: DUF1015 domain-containing protein [Propionibacteriaceae bacterium]|jgi:uncharacterized protein (DUF1015 family)|nr:DUF1015 domain-containing protein [Propionibacteriaceae bacterium]
MPDFRPFPALRYAHDIDLSAVLSPPYDVLSDADAERLRASDPHNITRIDVPEAQNYDAAAELLWRWVEDGVLTSDMEDTLSIYRLSFTDAMGSPRQIVGVFGGLEVVDEVTDPLERATTDAVGTDQAIHGVLVDESDGSEPTDSSHDGSETAGGAPDNSAADATAPRRTTVLPHERTTPKAKTDRLELTQATSTNLSPVWGLSLARGLTDALAAPGQIEGSVEVDGVVHTVEKISDPARIETIRAIIASDDVLIADGHHRYAISRTYRDEVRSATGRTDTAAEQTLTFVNELIDEQLSIEAIHRLYAGVDEAALRAGLATRFDFAPLVSVTEASLARMVELGRMIVVWADGRAEWLIPHVDAFTDVRALDGVWLETALADVPADVTYQHGLSEVLERVGQGDLTAAILIRPTSIEEIRRTAREGLLMPPKSTFFTPKLLTGWVLRPTEPLPGQ